MLIVFHRACSYLETHSMVLQSKDTQDQLLHTALLGMTSAQESLLFQLLTYHMLALTRRRLYPLLSALSNNWAVKTSVPSCRIGDAWFLKASKVNSIRLAPRLIPPLQFNFWLLVVGLSVFTCLGLLLSLHLNSWKVMMEMSVFICFALAFSSSYFSRYMLLQKLNHIDFGKNFEYHFRMKMIVVVLPCSGIDWRLVLIMWPINFHPVYVDIAN